MRLRRNWPWLLTIVLTCALAAWAQSYSFGAVTVTTLSASGQITSTVTTGTAPFVIASTTVVANLHVATADNLGTTTSANALIRTCEITVGDPGAASSLLVDDNDTPQVCANDTSATMTITAVHCYAPAGSPTVTPIITGGAGTSILSGALTCSNTTGGAAGSLNGTPTQTTGQLIDANITTAGGTAKYLVIRITRTL